MKESTKQYLLNLQELTDQRGISFVEPSDDFNRGYAVGRRLMLMDIITAMMKLEGEEI